jgi:hypothetical protein
MISSLSKNQLIKLIKTHPDYQNIPKNYSKNKLIELATQLNINPKNLELSEYNNKLLLEKCKHYTDFKRTKHGSSKKKMIEFLNKKEQDERKHNQQEIKIKLFQCLTEENDLNLSDEEIKNEINFCLQE